MCGKYRLPFRKGGGEGGILPLPLQFSGVSSLSFSLSLSLSFIIQLHLIRWLFIQSDSIPYQS